jgi:hypothetical protein
MADLTGKTRNALLVATAICAMATPCLAQEKGGAGTNSASDNVEQRVHRQNLRVNHALKSGLITEDQAKKLRDTITDIASDAQNLRQQNGGALKPEDLKKIENSLNQSSEQIKSVAESGSSTVESGKVLGATWTKGPDGAQNPKKLLNQMKQENKRELRQERQATEQKIEQQQQQYEKEMVEKLGEQKQEILKNKDDIRDIRKESGAD